MPQWTAFPFDGTEYRYSAAELRTHWARLHRGDGEPLPTDDAVLAAWALFHAGHFQQAVQAGLQAGGAGVTAANKAQVVYANYLEPSARHKLALFLQVADRAEAQAAADPGNANAFFLMAYALGRYGQGLGVSQALGQGLGTKVKSALQAAIRLQPAHADAHLALGTFHAEVIDKVGSLLGSTQGASKEAGLKVLREALELNPGSAIVMVEYANGLVMLEGEKRMAEAETFYAAAAACTPMDAMERLDVEMAKAALQD